MTKPDTGGRGEGRSSDLVMVEREVLADALAFLESEMHWSQPAPDMGEEPSDQFTYDAIPVAMALRSALQSVEGGVQGSIATKQESCPESAPRTETAVREALPFGIIDPKYAAFYTVARLTAWSYGYAIAMHGSFTRDLDLIAIPWTDAAVSPEKLIHQIQYRTGCTPVKPNASIREHGRIVWTLSFPEFDCPRFVDFSIIPPVRLDTQLTKTPSADHDDGNLRAKLDIAISALEFARDGYERTDIKHIEYRVGVYTTACDALDKIALPSISNHQPHAVSQGWRTDLENAPRDGTWFLTVNADEGADSFEVGKYDPYMTANFVEVGDNLFRKELRPSYDWTGFNNFHRATHWMPLPAPPSPAKTGGVEG